VLRVSVADVLLPALIIWGQPIMKSRIQLQKEVCNPRLVNLVMSLECTMVLNSEI
jgi:hypothetical protein